MRLGYFLHVIFFFGKNLFLVSTVTFQSDWNASASVQLREQQVLRPLASLVPSDAPHADTRERRSALKATEGEAPSLDGAEAVGGRSRADGGAGQAEAPAAARSAAGQAEAPAAARSAAN